MSARGLYDELSNTGSGSLGFMCRRCGALAIDMDRHDDWHNEDKDVIDAEPVNTCAAADPDPIPLRVDRFVVGDGEEQVTVTWGGTGWDIADNTLLGLHLWVGARDINESGEALARARDLVLELRRIASLRTQVAKAEAILRDQDTPF